MAEPLHATFYAFRKRERSGVLTRATVVFVMAYLALFGAFAALNWQAVVDYIAWAASVSNAQHTGAPPSPEAMMPPASVMGIAPMYLLLTIVTYLLMAAYESACLKWVIRGETSGFFGLAFDADMWRVWFTYWLWLVLFMAFYIVCLILVGGVGVAIGMSSQGNPEAVVPLLFIAPVILLLGLLFFGVRFAPAAATTIARRRFSFFSAWTVTKGRFWALLGSYLLLFLMYFVAVIIGYVAIAAVIGMSMFNGSVDPKAMEGQIMSQLATPSVWIPVVGIYVAIVVVAFVFIVALYGVNARAASLALQEGKIKVAE